MKMKLAISYILGAATGAACAFYVTRDYYRKLADEEIQSVKESLSNAKKAEPVKESEKVEESVEEEPEEDPAEGKYVNYTNKYKGGGEAEFILNTLAEKEYPGKDDVEVGPKKKKDKKKKGARIIKADDYDGSPEYRKLVVYFYVGDAAIADEEDETDLVGTDGKSLGKYKDYIPEEVLNKYGFIDNDNEGTVFIRNEDIRCDFEVIKDFGTFSDFNKEE